ncbi:MAG: hypothetical protein R2705_15835 [Ilumatobacteraceae bacterium]
MMTERINLIVLFGGQSAEHDVSCVTATHVLRAVDTERYQVTAIGIDRTERGIWPRTRCERSPPDRLHSRPRSIRPVRRANRGR